MRGSSSRDAIGCAEHLEAAADAQLLDVRADQVGRRPGRHARACHSKPPTATAGARGFDERFAWAAILAASLACAASAVVPHAPRRACCAAMRAPIALSKTKLLSLAQCRRKLWLETYSPELVPEPSAEKTALLATGNVVGEIARQLYGRGAGHVVSFERGLRAAIDATRALVARRRPRADLRGDVRPRRRQRARRRARPQRAAAEAHRGQVVGARQRPPSRRLRDPSVGARRRTASTPRQIAVATLNPEFVYAGDGRYEGLARRDRRDGARAGAARRASRELVAAARRTLADLDEPAVAVGTHCGAPHGCEFYAHCAPPAGKYPVLALGGSKEKLVRADARGLRATCATFPKRSSRTTCSGASGSSRGSKRRTSAPSCARS